MKKELYYIVPKEIVDEILNEIKLIKGLKQQQVDYFTSKAKLINLSDEAIEEIAKKEIKSEIGIIYYKQALIDIKQ